ncbi:uncharacterized protein LOC129945678 [Eupeodes corollae]|uniref:uncharacterized protein LOC129945678 n=1 Tax=Eupeodes corollae TaxID=290404 RepID=UPI00249309E0|nr:uncharacterized protein LOC129945678 [Eupeodes corollae]
MNSTPPSICHEDIYNFPFPYKLWIAVHSVTCEFIKWNIDGTQIQVHLMALDNYLNRPKSIFKVKSRSSFVTYLRSYAFQLNKTEVVDSQEATPQESSASVSVEFEAPKYSEVVMHFSHEHFLRHRIDLLARIRKTNDINAIAVGEEKPTSSSVNNGANGSEEDLCYRCIGSSSQLFRAHLKHQLILHFLSETKALQIKLKASEMKAMAKENIEGNEEDSVIELSAELFENPHDSVLYMGDEHRTAYAGFYGNCTNEQVFNFFGPYLPMYESENNDEGEKQIANLCPTEKPPSPPNGFEVKTMSNEEPAIPVESITQQNSPISVSFTTVVDLPSIQQNVTLTSSLEPIFIPDEDKNEDISMDEFIKFKEQSENQELNEPIEEQPKVKMEGNSCITQNNQENEDNFKSFFSHYRESLSLLYEKQ